MEQRRQAFLDASVRNPYFKYSAVVTVAMLIMAMLYAKHWIDHRRSMWITAEMMTDLYNHDAYSRNVAREAIQKYNDHIERCNRAIEAAASTECPRPERIPTRTVSGANWNRSGAKGILIDATEIWLRTTWQKRNVCWLTSPCALKRWPRNRMQTATWQVPVDMRTADQKLVQHINNLQEQLYAAQLENKRLKGER